MKNKTTAALLAWFTGAFGGHKFYLGQTGLGIVYLLFFWTLLPALAAFVETIMLISMSQKDFDVKFNAGVQASSVDLGTQIAQLHALKQQGAISDSEFEVQKAKAMSRAS